MFGFLKDKLKGALGKLSKEVEKESTVEKKETIVETKKEVVPEKKVEKKPVVETKKEAVVEKKVEKKEQTIAQKEELKSEKKESIIESKIEKPVEEKVIDIEEPKKKGFFQRIFGKKEDKEEISQKEKDTEEETDEEIEEELLSEKEELKTEDITIKTEDLRERAEHVIVEPTISKSKTKEKESTKSIDTKKYQPTESKKDVKVDKKHEIKIDSKIEPKVFEKKKEIFEHKPQIKEDKSYKIEVKQTPTIEVQTEEKEKTKTTAEKITEKVKDEKPIEIKEHPKPIHLKPEIKEKPHHQVVEESREKKPVEHKEEERKGFFTKITETFTKVQISEEKFEELFWDLEVVLLENNVAVEVIDKIKRDLKKELMAGKVSRKGVEELILSTLRQSITELFDVEKINLIERIKAKKKTGQPYIIAIIGVNGSGKTTSIAKLTHKFQKEGLQVVLAASDTFRAAAIQQLEEHANRLNVKMVKHDYNSDPAAVAFDAIKYAEARNADVVIIDTAGRLHSNTNLMRELEKVIRVCKPDIKIFVGESITGNDCVEQAKEFDKAVGIDAIILAKADVDDKGGAAISVSYILQRPILYIGTGQTYDDLKEFDSDTIIKSLEL